MEQVVVEHREGLLDVLLGTSSHLRNLRVHPLHGQHPGAQGHFELMRAELHPGVDHAALDQILAVETDWAADASNVPCDGRAGEDASLVSLEDWNSASLLSRTALRRLDLQTHVLGRDEGLLGLVV